MPFHRLLCLVLLSLLAPATGLATSVAERSPFHQGHWWNPARSGSGFDFFSANGQSMIVWYTYEESGRSIWYTAQGSVASLGQDWPLLKHRWADGRKADATVVGKLRLDVRLPEVADVSWEIGSQRGTWAIQPFRVSGVTNEADHTGSWFDASNSGWGLAFTEQGDVAGGVLFTYDATGEPTWAAGFDRTKGSAELYAGTGACPWCPYRPSSLASVGRLAFEPESELRMTLRNRLSMPMAPGLTIDGARVTPLSRPASWRGADRQLANFDSEAALKAYLEAAMLNVSSSGAAADFSAAPAPAAYSTTNLQEAGVDEADLVKTNGAYIYAYAPDESGSYRLPAIRAARVLGEGAGLEPRAPVPLASGASTPMAAAGLYLHGDRLVSITGNKASGYVTSFWGASGLWTRGKVYVEIMRTANPDQPVTEWRAEIDGYVVSSRRIGDRLYVVTRHVPDLPGFYYGVTYGPGAESNRQLVASATLAALLPKIRVNGGPALVAVSPAEVFVPPLGSRPPVADMIVVTAIDLAAPRIAQTFVLASSVEAVYVSTGNLYLASARNEIRAPLGPMLATLPAITVTDIHQLALGANAMTVVASGTVEGFLSSDIDKSAFRLSEHRGQIRVVSGTGLFWASGSKNRLTILEPSTIAPGLLKTVSYLPNDARPDPIGKPHELLYGVRFMGDRLYAVTFKKVDPLYVIDLADSRDPRIAGALELPGFSDYLHPLPNGLLLGFGKDASPAEVLGDGQFAWFQGLQLTLFDVRDASRPRELQRVVVGKRGSDSALLRDHHAFSSLIRGDGTGTIAIPARIHDGTPQPSPSMFLPWVESGLLRYELRGTGADARLVALQSLVTHRASSNSIGDDAADGARSILFPNGTVYVGKGRFWRQEPGGTAYGPF